MTTLTMKEEKRVEIIQRLYRGDLTVVEASKRATLLPDQRPQAKADDFLDMRFVAELESDGFLGRLRGN